MIPDYLYENGKVVDSLTLDIYHMGLWPDYDIDCFMKIQVIDNKIVWELEFEGEIEEEYKEWLIDYLQGWEEGYDFLYSLEDSYGTYSDPDTDFEPSRNGYFPGNKFLIFKEN